MFNRKSSGCKVQGWGWKFNVEGLKLEQGTSSLKMKGEIRDGERNILNTGCRFFSKEAKNMCVGLRAWGLEMDMKDGYFDTDAGGEL